MSPNTPNVIYNHDMQRYTDKVLRLYKKFWHLISWSCYKRLYGSNTITWKICIGMKASPSWSLPPFMSSNRIDFRHKKTCRLWFLNHNTSAGSHRWPSNSSRGFVVGPIFPGALLIDIADLLGKKMMSSRKISCRIRKKDTALLKVSSATFNWISKIFHQPIF